MELHYFLTTNGANGHTDFLPDALSDYRSPVTLYGYPRELCSSLLRECYAIAKQSRTDIHIVHNCLDNSMEGLFLPAMKTAVINRPLYEKRTDALYLLKNEELDRCQSHLNEAFSAFLCAKKIHDDWEKIYIDATDYTALDAYCNGLIEWLLANKKADGHGQLCDRFFGSATIDGSKDYVENLSAGLKRYFIKGRPGTGKSTFLKKLAQAASARGFDAERYHCSFDPRSLDMVAVRQLGFCVFDSTAPHEYFPSQKEDEILDFYAAAVAPNTDDIHAALLADTAASYKEAIGRATSCLIAANDACRKAENELLPQFDQDRLMQVRKSVIERIFP